MLETNDLRAIMLKKDFFIYTLLLFSTNGFCQMSATAFQKSEGLYIQKSVKQKRAAWILTGAGVALMGTAAMYNGRDPFHIISGSLYTAGASISIAGIGLFIPSSKDRKRAHKRSLMLRGEKSVRPRLHHRVPWFRSKHLAARNPNTDTCNA